ncbi:AADAT isoform 2 [Balamuthia mandrillaris]
MKGSLSLRSVMSASSTTGGGGGGANRIRDYGNFLSRVAKRRAPSAIRSLQPLMQIPGMISLGGGVPNPEYFPVEAVQVKLKSNDVLTLEGKDMETALSYSSSYGIPELVEWLKDFQDREHKVPYPSRKDWHVCVTSGSADANCKAFEMLINEGDYVFTEDPTYSGSLSAIKPLGANIIGVQTDGEGLIPSHLRSLLQTWPAAQKKPKFVYIIPTGQNPSGSTLTLDRKREIYSLASQYDLLILEDDPYYYLQYGGAEGGRVPSFLSMDEEGRVIRFDSFSKIISSGLLGWATGPAPLIERLQLHQQVSSLHVSGISQMILLKMLQHWGHEGFHRHVAVVEQGYKERRDKFVELADKYLTGLAEWTVPSAGMFLWLKLLSEQVDESTGKKLPIHSSDTLIKEKAVNAKVLLVPGSSFSPSDKPSPYVRASFSTASPAEMEEALKRLVKLIKEDQS